MQAGEDLEEEEDEDKVADEEGAAEISSTAASQLHLSHLSEISESTPLLQTASSLSRSRSRRRRMSIGPHGDATVTQAVLMVRILCAFRRFIAHSLPSSC
jgi:solute carrier family 36 (proton-coupled amino acid transporter)